MKTLFLSEQERKDIDNVINKLIKYNIKQPAHREGPYIKSLGFPAWTNRNKYWLIDNNIFFDSGASKMVFSAHTIKNWVIKIPFLFSEKTCTGSRNLLNACETEAQVYAKAVLNGVDKYFAPMFYYKTADGIPFYLQRKAECETERITDTVRRYVSKSYKREYFETDEDYEAEIICDMDEMNDEEALCAFFNGWNNELIDFLDENEINDFHLGNFGFIDEQPVIIDYSGY